MTTATLALTAGESPRLRWARLPFVELGRVLLYALLFVALMLFAFLAVGPRVFGYRTVTMLTGSMRPLIPPGAVAVDVPEPVSALRAGQVVSFHAPEAGQPVITHRVIAVRRINGRTVIQTKGDANLAPDPWRAVVDGNTVWRVRGSVPYLGYGIHALRAGSTRMIVTWGVPLAALAWFVVGVWRPTPASEGGEPACPDPAPTALVGVASPARPSRSRSSSRRRSTSRSRSRKRRQRPMRNSQRRQRRSTRRSR